MLYSKIEGEGKPFVIMHGFLGMSDNWKTLGTQFASDGYQVHMLDLRNHGRSFHSDEFNMKQWFRMYMSIARKIIWIRLIYSDILWVEKWRCFLQ